MIEAINISKRFGSRLVLNGVDLVLRRGEVVGLVGLNGAGKTTLIDVLSGSIRPTDGIVKVNGIVYTTKRRARRLGFRTYQIPQVFEGLTVDLNHKLGAWANSHDGDLPNSLSHRSNVLASALSAGQRRRMNLEWLWQRFESSDCFFLDEPGAGSDKLVVDEHVEFISKAKQAGKVVVVIEHRKELLERACDYVVRLREGKVVRKNGSLLSRAMVAKREVNPSTARLEIRDLTVCRGGVNILENLSLDFPSNNLNAITGKNGCGKSTLLRAIHGDPELRVTGSIVFIDDGIQVKLPRPQMIFQNGNLFETMTVRDSIRVSVTAINTARWNKKAIASLWNKVPKLKEIWSTKSGALSGGERKLASIAKLLLLKPQIALIDEPLAGVDEEHVNIINQLLTEMKGDTIIVAAEQEPLIPNLFHNTVQIISNKSGYHAK